MLILRCLPCPCRTALPLGICVILPAEKPDFGRREMAGSSLPGIEEAKANAKANKEFMKEKGYDLSDFVGTEVLSCFSPTSQAPFRGAAV